MIGPAIALVSVAAAGNFLKGAIAEARESQKVGAVTAQIIKSTGGAANITAGQVGKLTTAISNKAGVDDEAIQSGANLLLTFKNVKNEVGSGNQIFNRATQAAVDLSAAGFGSITGASKQLGKALNDPIKGIAALNKAGVTFTDQQKAQIKTLVESGDVLGAQKIIMKEVESQVGGTAAASATSGEKLKVAFDNFKESIGTALLPALDSVEKILTNTVIPALLNLGPTLSGIATTISGFFTGISSGSGQAGALFVQFQTTLATAWVNIQAIFSSATIIITTLWNTFGATIVSGIQSALSAVLTIVSGAFEVIAGIFKVFSALLQGDWQGVWDGIQQILEGAWKVIQGIVDLAWTNLETAFKLAGEAVKKVFGAIWTDIQTLAATGIKNLVDAVAAVPGKLLALLGKFKDAGKSLVEGLIHGLSNAGSAASDFADTIWKAVKSVINSGIDQLNALLEFKVAIPGAPDIHVNPPDIGHLFRGTNNWRGGPTWVGERGPEILNLPRGSQVVPNNQIGAVGPMAAGGASTSSPSLDGAQITIVDGGHMANSFQGIVTSRSDRMVSR